MTEVVPAIIPYTKTQLEEEVEKVAKFTSLVQIDISDGIFTPFKTWPYNGRDADFWTSLKTETVGWPRWEEVDFEIHLMVKSPENVVLDWIHTGASTIVAHIEATDNFQTVIDLCKQNDVKIGLAIKPKTDISIIEPFVPQIDFIQVMGSDTLGKHGVELDPLAVEKIKILHGLYPSRIIAIDIGVGEGTEDLLVSSGATRLISGSAILNSPNPKEVFEDLETPN